MPSEKTPHLTPERARRIIDECYGSVLAYCRRHAPVGHKPEDLAQEAFLHFARSGGHRAFGKPIVRLLRIARNLCINENRLERMEAQAIGCDVANATDKSDKRALAKAFASLPEDQREIVELRFGIGLDIADVARVLGISRLSAQQKVDATLKRLESLLEEGDADGRGPARETQN